MKWMGLLTILCVLSVPLGVQAAVPGIVINELSWAGSTEFGSNDEWIELYNPSGSAADISGWQLTKLTSGSTQLMLTLPANSSIPAGGYFLISNFDMAGSALGVEPDVVNSAITLSNSALQVKLYNGNWQTAELVDTAGDGSAPPAGSNETPKASMERVGNTWQTATTKTNLDEATNDSGTPKAPNSAVPPAQTVPGVSAKFMLAAKDITAHSVKLKWSVELADLRTVSLWQSPMVDSAGREIKILPDEEGETFISGLEPGEQYFFYLYAVDKGGGVYRSVVIGVKTALPEPILAITEIMPKPSGTLPAFIEIRTEMPTKFFNNQWRIRSGAKETTMTVPLQSDTAKRLVAYGLPDDFFATSSQVSIWNDEPRPVATIDLGPMGEGSFALAYNQQMLWTTKVTPGGENVIITGEMNALQETVAGERDLPVTGGLGILGWITVAILASFGIALEGYYLYTSRQNEKGLDPKLGE